MEDMSIRAPAALSEDQCAASLAGSLRRFPEGGGRRDGAPEPGRKGDGPHGHHAGHAARCAGRCGQCGYCLSDRENLCDDPLFTGFTRDGGFASHCIADTRYCFPIPSQFDDIHAAPLLCAGLIGYRAYRLAGDAGVLGLYGFGAAAHILAQLAVWQGRKVFAFTREGDEAGQRFALKLGCARAGSSSARPLQDMDAAIIFAPAGELVPLALKSVRKGGRVVCAGVHMSDIPAFPYADLWQERSILSVANLTRRDGSSSCRLPQRFPSART